MLRLKAGFVALADRHYVLLVTMSAAFLMPFYTHASLSA
jgi:hypothetical protein